MNKNVLSKLSKIESKVELSDVKVDLALLDDLSKISMESGSLLVLQSQQTDAFQKLDKSIILNKKGLAEAEKGFKAAQDLGDPKTIEIFKNWIKSFTTDIQRAEKGKKLVAQLSNI